MPEITTDDLFGRFDPKKYRIYLSSPYILLTKEGVKKEKKEGYIICIKKSQIIER